MPSMRFRPQKMLMFPTMLLLTTSHSRRVASFVAPTLPQLPTQLSLALHQTSSSVDIRRNCNNCNNKRLYLSSRQYRNFSHGVPSLFVPRPSSSLYFGNIERCSRLFSSQETTSTSTSTPTASGASANNDKNENWYSPSLMSHMLYRIQQCNTVPEGIRHCLLDFCVDGKLLGKVTPKVAERLCSITLPSSSSPAFELIQLPEQYQQILTLTPLAGTTPDERTESVAYVMTQLRDSNDHGDSGYMGLRSGWRNEYYPVAEKFEDVSKPLFLIERAAASLLGVLEYGVHINGIVLPNQNEGNGEMPKMWMARRSKTKSKFPGYLDHIVAGGQPAGLSLMENVIKECMEEAGIPEELTRSGIRPGGAISYENYGERKEMKGSGEGVMNRVVLFCFDLYLPSDFIPVANDGEVECFFQWKLEDIAKSMDPEYDDPIKPNCYPVIIDYLMRSGFVMPDSPRYLEILRTLRSGSCV